MACLPLADDAVAALGFRPLAIADLPLLHEWLNETLVRQWYSRGEARSPEYVERTYGPRIRGDVPTQCFICAVDGADVGMVQRYWVADWPAYAAAIAARPGWMGVDYLIGVPTVRGRGYGSGLVRRFVETEVFGAQRARACVSAPDCRNEHSLRLLRRAGFTSLRVVHAADDPPELLMIRHATE